MSDIKQSSKQPRHIAIIMDGNGRWAKANKRPRFLGHQAGLKAVRVIVEQCVTKEIEVLTLFAFSSENWRRPPKEVSMLMELFMGALNKEIKRLHRNNVRLYIIGDRSAFSERLQVKIAEAEATTAENTGLVLQIAANYGGRWDITQAARQIAKQVAAGELDAESVDEELMSSFLSFPHLPEPDLFIRTGGEKRVSNFLLWQAAYAEMYFTDTYWPGFNAEEFQTAIDSFAGRQRRFGRTGDQVENQTTNSE